MRDNSRSQQALGFLLGLVDKDTAARVRARTGLPGPEAPEASIRRLQRAWTWSRLLPASVALWILENDDRRTMYAHFVTGGFRHDAAWYAYGPYLTLQLAHAYLLAGNPERMDALLGWTVGAGSPFVAGRSAALGAWNEQHAYPVASDFREVPFPRWYMGDIPHGWAAAEYPLLIRDILFFEADEDRDRHLYIAPGVRPHWVPGGAPVGVDAAPTLFGSPFGYRLGHDPAERTVTVEITEAPEGVRFVCPCAFGEVRSVSADGRERPATGRDVRVPAGIWRFSVTYA
ncbi:hypothetical protein [Streptomyces sp. P17]|uniref:hypothetical protein n=1 Tax=Streptomyces sp. P17 TaxID=3074716 RepID=UPI0028F3E75D|nr:hypothetical protein [Streptomyces sp. P17]MDT9694860.1 hypothetical protein [Streptomyces sp. P17]